MSPAAERGRQGRAAEVPDGRACEAHDQLIADLRAEIAGLERARDAARAANEAKTRFLSSFCHEIRSPLNAIYGYAQLLERGHERGSDKAATVIRRSAEHLASLVEGLLDIARAESGSLRLNRETIRFRAFLEQLLDMFELQASAKGLALGLACGANLPEFVRTDPRRLRQVLINLLSNAIKFTAEGSVTLRVRYANEIATFDVIDTGIGIAPAVQEQLFVPFVRGPATSCETAGFGLGLAITQALVRIMGGDIEVESEPGRGSRFTVRLMLPQPPEPPDDPPAARSLAHYLGHTRTVLVIDDDPVHRDMLTELLKTQGFRVLCAETGRAGLALAEEAKPDLALVDGILGTESGWKVAEALRACHGPRLRIVILSGAADAPGPDGGRAPGVDLVIAKPCSVDALLDVLARQLALEWPSHPAGHGRDLAIPPGCDTLPAGALAGLARIERLAGIGHVRGIETEIEALARLGPAAEALAEDLRRLLDVLDLHALADRSRRARQP
ncbi:ATP-binding response regulator [Thermaurantiacus sp.]